MSNRHTPDSTDKKRNSSVTRKIVQKERYRFHASPPAPPIIATKLLAGDRLSFLDFLEDEQCGLYLKLLFGERGTASATMLRDFYHARRGLYFGYRRAKSNRRPPPKNPGVLDKENTRTKAALMEFARRAYRGDPERRGQVFWKRVAWLLWNAYEALMASRARCKDIEQREIKRISRLGMKRKKGAARVQKHRAKMKAERIKQAERASTRSI